MDLTLLAGLLLIGLAAAALVWSVVGALAGGAGSSATPSAATYLHSDSTVLRIRTRAGRVVASPTRPAARLVARWTPESEMARLRRRAEAAGGAHLVETVHVARAAGAVGAVLLWWATSPFLGVVGLLSAWFGPALWLDRRGRARAEAVRAALPDFLDLLAISVEAGAGLDAAMARAAGEVGGPLGEEFTRLLRTLDLGASRRSAFTELKDRVGVRELSTFVLALLQAESLGVSQASMLRTQAAEMRALRRRRAREQAARTPVKILFPLVFGIFPALMIVVLGPAGIRIMQTLLGS